MLFHIIRKNGARCQNRVSLHLKSKTLCLLSGNTDIVFITLFPPPQPQVQDYAFLFSFTSTCGLVQTSSEQSTDYIFYDDILLFILFLTIET